MAQIYFIDVTNRDGVQTANLGLSKLEKTMINMYLNEMGVFQSEFGFPTTRHESLYLQANLELADMGILQPIRLAGWIRAIVADVDEAFRLVPSIKHLNISVRHQALTTLVSAISSCRQFFSSLNISKISSNATRKPTNGTLDTIEIGKYLKPIILPKLAFSRLLRTIFIPSASLPMV